jgi:predicted SprT family Zn-dependent metalloprotease
MEWHQGPSFGGIFPTRGDAFVLKYGPKSRYYVDPEGQPLQYNTVVTNNGEEWAFFVTADGGEMVAAKMFGLLRKDYKVWNSSVSHLEPSLRLPLEWAKKEITRLKKSKKLKFDEVHSTKAIQVVSRESKPMWNKDVVIYDGFDVIKKRSAHTLKAIHDSIDRSTKLTKLKWNWVPIRPTVSFHSKSNAMGLAYNPGGGEHIISLNVRMLADYNMKSIFRVMLHEWCHHFRDEKFPRTTDPHDSKFCELLSIVDPIVADNRKECTFFTDIKDVAIAALKQKKSTKKSPVFTPQAGDMVLEHMKDGSYTIRWVPKGKYKWSAVRFKLDTVGTFEKFLNNFAREDLPKVRAILASRHRLGNYKRRMPAKNYVKTTYNDKEALLTTLWDMTVFLYQTFPNKQLEDILMEADEHVE